RHLKGEWLMPSRSMAFGSAHSRVRSTTPRPIALDACEMPPGNYPGIVGCASVANGGFMRRGVWLPAFSRWSLVRKSIDECREGRNGFTVRAELVHFGFGIGIAKRHPTNEDLIGRNAQSLFDHLVILAECRLWTGIEAKCARHNHDRL